MTRQPNIVWWCLAVPIIITVAVVLGSWLLGMLGY